MLKSLVALVAFCAASVSAQTPPVTVTQPLSDFTLNAGQTYVIAWVNPVVPSISQLWLASGASTALTKVELIAQNIATAPLSYSWAIDPKLPTGQYSLEFGLAPNIAYAGPFTINGGGGAPASGSASASAAANGTDSAASAPPAATSAAGSSAPAPASASASPSAASAAGATPSSPAAAGSPSSTPSTPAATSTKASSAKMVAPVALLALVPAIVALL